MAQKIEKPAVPQLKDMAEFEKFKENAGSKLVVIDYTATWCPPCQAIKPIFVNLAQEHSDVCFAKIDVDENQEVVGKHGIRAMPTFQFWKKVDGKMELVHHFEGASAENLEAAVKKYK